MSRCHDCGSGMHLCLRLLNPLWGSKKEESLTFLSSLWQSCLKSPKRRATRLTCSEWNVQKCCTSCICSLENLPSSPLLTCWEEYTLEKGEVSCRPWKNNSWIANQSFRRRRRVSFGRANNISHSTTEGTKYTSRSLTRRSGQHFFERRRHDNVKSPVLSETRSERTTAQWRQQRRERERLQKISRERRWSSFRPPLSLPLTKQYNKKYNLILLLLHYLLLHCLSWREQQQVNQNLNNKKRRHGQVTLKGRRTRFANRKQKKESLLKVMPCSHEGLLPMSSCTSWCISSRKRRDHYDDDDDVNLCKKTSIMSQPLKLFVHDSSSCRKSVSFFPLYHRGHCCLYTRRV